MENWVQSRANCSLDKTFRVLREMIDNDVKAANGLKRSGVTFELNEPKGKLMVIRERDLTSIKETACIVFELRSDKITVTERSDGTPKELFSAVPCLNEEGECLLEVEGQALQLWQVRRRALENLFFFEV